MFISYTENTILPFFSTHTVQYHLFADDTQSYDHTSVSAVPSSLNRLSSCVADLANSYASLRLQLNPTKSGFILFGSRRNLAKLSDDCRAITVCSSVIQLVHRCWTGSWRSVRQWDDHAATHQQGYQCSLLSPSDPELCQSNRSWHNLWCLSSSHASTTATQSLPVYLHADWCHCNEYKTRSLDCCHEFGSASAHQSCTTYNSCTGFRSSIARHVQDSHTNASNLTKTFFPISLTSWHGNI